MNAHTPMLMFGFDRTFTVDGQHYSTVAYAGVLGVDVWHEFRVLRRDGDGSLWTMTDEGVVGQFEHEATGHLIEAQSVADALTRAEDYADQTGADISGLRATLGGLA